MDHSEQITRCLSFCDNASKNEIVDLAKRDGLDLAALSTACGEVRAAVELARQRRDKRLSAPTATAVATDESEAG